MPERLSPSCLSWRPAWVASSVASRWRPGHQPSWHAICSGAGLNLDRQKRALLLFVLILAGPARAADPVLAPTGTLRAAYIVTNLAQARLDPGTGAITGVVADIARELGRRAGIAVTIAPLPTAAAVLGAVQSGAADIGFVAPNPERTGVVLYSQTYMLVQQSALVRADSPLRSVNELDRPGQVIGVNTDDSVGVWLKQRLTAAQLHTTPDYTLRDAVEWLQNRDVVAFAGGRQRLDAGTRDVSTVR